MAVIANKESIKITSEKGNAILVSESDWNSIQETMYLLSIPNMKESILKSEKELLEECKSLEKIGWNLDNIKAL
ncbi:type II toxin-antitoxin system Phd/YefM family antitoxin [Clostridium sp. JS66]|uniref:type II toxin-antitoxin system Phd/YefM family antitoxin n=1 Tax=Clostridium sp. JS66 TaxID=3064705 RepID=UPI00298E2635|nr:type II toxin-antitoxin system Phd/YefM family antitoxin [Clostridium sp. JS66]WPC40058.1 type II toxin-antitoxin system Phd/YefM family antitoxin [Clostridium sp. JS66]